MMHDFEGLGELFTLFPASGEPPAQLLPMPGASTMAFLEQIHRRKSEMLKAVLAERSWPNAARFGDKAEAAAFMIAQHADYDPELQKECHVLLLESAVAGTTRQLGFLAFMTDRILCNSGLLQRFATQLREVVNGCFVPRPMEDPDEIDVRRRRAGLGESLTDYLQRVNDGDLLFYRPLIGDYARELEYAKEHKVIEFPGTHPN